MSGNRKGRMAGTNTHYEPERYGTYNFYAYGSDKTPDRRKRLSDYLEKQMARGCVLCGEKSVYGKYGYGFCANHKENAAKFIQRFQNIRQLQDAGLFKDINEI